jgi:Tol biopolymer transport system component
VTAASGYELFTISPNGASRRQVTSPKGLREDFDPAWAPDGSWIAYMQVDGTRSARTLLDLRHETQRIYLVRPNGSHAHSVTGIQAWTSNPDWSLNSKKLVTARVGVGGGAPRGLSVLHLGSGGSHWFVRGQCFDPSWS